MGFRNPFRVQVDENDVAYISDYSPDSNTPQRSRGPAGTGRYEIVRKPSNYGWPHCYSSKLGYYQWNFHEWSPTTARTPRRAPTPGHAAQRPAGADATAAARHQINDSRWNLEGGPAVEPGLRELPPVTDPDVWYSYHDNNATTPLGTPCFGYYATTPGHDRAGLDDRMPAAVPRALHGRRGRARHREVQLRRRQPEPEEVPALLRRLGDPGRVRPGHDARDQARRRQPRVQDQPRS